jgi:hypothetical protein
MMSYADGAPCDGGRVLFADLEENILLKSAHEASMMLTQKRCSRFLSWQRMSRSKRNIFRDDRRIINAVGRAHRCLRKAKLPLKNMKLEEYDEIED